MTKMFTYLSNWKLKYTCALFVLLCAGVGNVWGTANSTTYTFTSASWTATSGGNAANWTSGKAGAGFSNNGIQVTTAATGANGTSPASFSNVTKVVLTYNTNKSSGDGTIYVKVGSNTAKSAAWAYSSGDGRTANYTATIDYTTPESGYVQVTCSTTNNSIYLVSAQIYYGYTVTYDKNGGSGTMTDTDSPYASGATVTVKSNSFTAPDGKTFAGWNTAPGGGGTSYAAGATFSISAHTTLYAQWVSACSYKVTLTKGSPSNGSISLNKSEGSHDNCDEDFEVIVTPTPAEGYACTAVTESDGTHSIVDGPDGDGKYTVLYDKGYSITSTISATFAAKVATPEMSVSGGTYNTTQSVTLSCDTEDATIYYTTNGSTPTTSSSVYSSAISVTTTNTTIKAIAVKDGMPNSDVASATYVLKCATPTFSPVAGTYTGAQDVAISCGMAGADIFYSTDGTDPDGSNEYSSAINVATSKTLKAIASKTGWTDSDIASAAYTIQYSITWLVNGDEWTPHDPKSDPDDGKVNGSNKVNSGTAWSSLTLPTDPDPASDGCGQEFMGWVTAAIVGKLDKDVPADATAISLLDLLNKENKSDKTSETITATTTFYAVFADIVE